MTLSEIRNMGKRTKIIQKTSVVFLPIMLLTITFIMTNHNVYSQTESQITKELNRRGINTLSEINDALRAQGMTEAEARKMAKVYGINYDDYISDYILKKSEPDLNLGNLESKNEITETTTSITYNSDEVVKNLETVPAPKVDEKYFGYDIFQNNPYANKDYLIGNIDENYIVGPGDEIRIYVWGSHAYQAQVKIDLNGNIALPENGVFFASGYKFETLKKKLSAFLSKSYSGLNSVPQTSFIDVSLTQLRPVSVTVLGESNAPGQHLVNGLADVLNALYASGGVKTSGSLREIHVYRNNKLINTIDLYDYITNGNMAENVRLMNNDVVFIPIRKNSITLNGAVNKSGVFELKNNEGLNELIMIAGGLKPTASTNNIKIKRIKPFDSRNDKEIYDRFITSVDYSALNVLNDNYTLFDGDEIFISNILGKVLNQVSITGPVKRPGTFALNEFPDVRSLIISGADSLLPRVYMDRMNIYRTNEDGTRNFYSFNLKNILDDNENFPLQNEDLVKIFSLNSTEGDDRYITISSFDFDGRKRFSWNENFTLYDLIFQSVSIDNKEFKVEVLTSRVDIDRFNTETGLYFKKSFDLDDILSGKENEFLSPKDHVTLYSKDINSVLNKFVTINGYVKNPGIYKLTEQMSPEDLILSAGGYTEYALKNEVNVSRPKFNVELGEISEEFSVAINSDYVLGNIKIKSENSFILNHRDVVSVKQLAGVEFQKSILISGEVIHPGSISINNKRQSLKEIIDKAGGITPFGSLKTSYIDRGGELFVLDLKKALKKKAPFLKNGDKIHVGENYGSVTLKGAISNEGLFVWQPNKRLKKYIKYGGGLDGKIEKIIVEYPNGIKLKKLWYTNPRILPNTKIYVYSKRDKEKKEKNGNGMDKFIEIITVITGALSTALLARAL